MIQTKTCPVCGKEFRTGGRGYPHHDVRFCSHRCGGLHVHPPMTPEDFWSKMDKSGDCWLWTMGTVGRGYGQLKYNGVQTMAHRVAWKLTNGPIPDGVRVCHHCDIPLCCNPDHLFLGTDADNVADMVAKGRHGHGNAKLTREQVAAIRTRLSDGATQTSIAKVYGVASGTISNIALGLTWRWLK